MKYTIYILLLFTSLISSQKEIPKATQLEMFLFKIGFTSLLQDVNIEKNRTKLNSQDIKKLKSDITYILNKLNVKQFEELSKQPKIIYDNSILLKKIENLEQKINSLKKIKLTNKLSKLKLYINVPKANIREKPGIKSKIVRKVYLNDIINIEFCNKHGWCKIKNKNQYIAKFLLNSFK
jgi:hypothetical protein